MFWTLTKSLKCQDSRGVSDLDVSDYLKQNSDFEKYHFIVRNISYFFHCFFSVWQKTSPAAVGATVIPSSSLQKRPQSALVFTLRSKFKKGKLPGKYAGVDANYVKEKEGMFDLQIIFPRNLFEVGAKFVPLFIKVVQYRLGKIEPVFIFNNEYFTKALTDLALYRVGN
jgi:hypothetical protein